jgi:hypothetical protein
MIAALTLVAGHSLPLWGVDANVLPNRELRERIASGEVRKVAEQLPAAFVPSVTVAARLVPLARNRLAVVSERARLAVVSFLRLEALERGERLAGREGDFHPPAAMPHPESCVVFFHRLTPFRATGARQSEK